MLVVALAQAEFLYSDAEVIPLSMSLLTVTSDSNVIAEVTVILIVIPMT